VAYSAGEEAFGDASLTQIYIFVSRLFLITPLITIIAYYGASTSAYTHWIVTTNDAVLIQK